MNLETIPDPVVGLCYKLSRRHPEPEDAMQELLLQAWLNRGLTGGVLVCCLNRRSIDLMKKRVGRPGSAKRPQFLTGEPFPPKGYRDPEPFEWDGPEPEVATLLAIGFSQAEIAAVKGIHNSNISRRCDLIRAHILAMRTAA